MTASFVWSEVTCIYNTWILHKKFSCNFILMTRGGGWSGRVEELWRGPVYISTPADGGLCSPSERRTFSTTGARFHHCCWLWRTIADQRSTHGSVLNEMSCCVCVYTVCAVKPAFSYLPWMTSSDCLVWPGCAILIAVLYYDWVYLPVTELCFRVRDSSVRSLWQVIPCSPSQACQKLLK
jgi:hypothetical protein